MSFGSVFAFVLALPSLLGDGWGIGSLTDILPGPVFRPDAAVVDNWRLQSAWSLDASLQFRTSLLVGSQTSVLPRCIRLNNYWCVKHATWPGEIGVDRDGHVAFASTEAGADAAARLLRDYYVRFSRKSAMQIVSRWAPDRCAATHAAPIVAVHATASPAAISQVDWRSMSPAGRSQAAERLIAVRRKLAEAHSHEVASLAQGLKRHPDARAPRPQPADHGSSPALRPYVARAAGPALPFCANERRRIDNYAQRMIDGVAHSVTEDLVLFDVAGAPTWRLAKVMDNMASVEIGPLHAGRNLSREAVRRLEIVNPATRPPDAASVLPPDLVLVR